MDSSQRTWFVGYFEEENTYSVIPNNLISRQDNNIVYCKWPRKQKVTTAMLSNAIEPSSNWSLYPVNLVERLCFDNYDNAVKKEVIKYNNLTVMFETPILSTVVGLFYVDLTSVSNYFFINLINLKHKCIFIPISDTKAVALLVLHT